MSLSSFFDGPQ